MMSVIDYCLDRSSSVLLLFVAGAALGLIVRCRPATRIILGLAAIAVAACVHISIRSGFEWIVSAIERPSAPGLLLLIIFAFTTVTGRSFDRSAEYRFGTGALVVAGLILYPGATGILNYDTYVLGYSGYLLPLALAALLAYAIYRRYLFVLAALDIGIAGFLLSAGRSLNLWDYVVDPVAWFLAIGAWIAILVLILFRKAMARSPVPA
jgi:hypothetical protein